MLVLRSLRILAALPPRTLFYLLFSGFSLARLPAAPAPAPASAAAAAARLATSVASFVDLTALRFRAWRMSAPSLNPWHSACSSSSSAGFFQPKQAAPLRFSAVPLLPPQHGIRLRRARGAEEPARRADGGRYRR